MEICENYDSFPNSQPSNFSIAIEGFRERVEEFKKFHLKQVAGNIITSKDNIIFVFQKTLCVIRN
jgi:hypothetical protein